MARSISLTPSPPATATPTPTPTPTPTLTRTPTRTRTPTPTATRYYDSLAEHLFDAAKLCALEGELDIAMRSLQLSLQTCGQDEATHPKLSKEDITRVDQVRPHQPYPNPDPSPDPKP